MAGWIKILALAAGVTAPVATVTVGPLHTFGATAPPARPTSRAAGVQAGNSGLGGDAWAQTRTMRTAARRLAAELDRAALCDLRSEGYERCVLPALRHTVMGGRTAAFVLRTVIAPVRPGGCRGYLLELQAANQEASGQAQWTQSQLYDTSVRDRWRRASIQIKLAAAMLHRATAPGGAELCSPAANGPAA